MRNFREQAIYNAFEIFFHAAIVYWAYGTGKQTFLARLRKRENTNKGISGAEYGSYFIWFIATASLGTMLYFTRGSDNESATFGLTTFLILFTPASIGIYMAAQDATENIKKLKL